MTDLLPRTADNDYRGHRLALWLMGALLLMKFAMSINSTFNGRSVLTTADGVPLDTYPAAAAQTIVALFAIYALGQFMLCALSTLVLIRYRSLVPLMFLLFLVEHLGRKAILQVIPIVRTGAPPAGVINLIVLGLIVAGLVVSLWRRR